MQKYVSVHPVIYRIDDTGKNSYLVYETLKFAFIPFSFTYPVTIEKDDINKTVKIRATVKKLTKVEMTFLLKKDGEFTSVEEEIQFKSILPVKSIMKRIFRKQHTQLFKNIELKTTE